MPTSDNIPRHDSPAGEAPQDDAGTIVDVAVPVPLRRNFAYRVPDGHDADSLKPGMRVLVSFARRRLTGWITAVDVPPPSDGIVIKPVDQVLDDEPVLPPDIISLIQWCASY